MADSFFEHMISIAAANLAAQSGHMVCRLAPGEGWDLVDAPQVAGEELVPNIIVRSREQDLHVNAAPPRVVFVAKGGDIDSPDLIGAQKTLVPGKSITAVRVRRFRVQVYCWGIDQGESEALVHATILALHQFHNAINFSDEVWEDQQTGEGGPSTLGTQISYIATADIMVTTLPASLTRPMRVKSEVSLLSNTTEISEP